MSSYPIDPDTGELFAPFFRTGYNYDRDAASFEAGQVNLDPSMTQQQFAEESDINTIVRRFGLTGQLPQNVRLPEYGDFSGITDYQGAMNAVREAQEAFMALPAAVRDEFSNDPQRLLEATADKRNLERFRELGLAMPAAPPAPAGESVAESVAAAFRAALKKEEKPTPGTSS